MNWGKLPQNQRCFGMLLGLLSTRYCSLHLGLLKTALSSSTVMLIQTPGIEGDMIHEMVRDSCCPGSEAWMFPHGTINVFLSGT